jgi:carbon storage regulator CsrA
MLVLSRQVRERILIPEVAATIEVVAIKANSVRLGIEAPAEIVVVREEIYRQTLSRGDLGVQPNVVVPETRRPPVQHNLTNRLNAVILGLRVLREQLPIQAVPAAETLLLRMEEELRTLSQLAEKEMVGAAS